MVYNDLGQAYEQITHEIKDDGSIADCHSAPPCLAPFTATDMATGLAIG